MKTFEQLIAEAPDEEDVPQLVPSSPPACPQLVPSEPTMSSLQIAEITGKNHKEVMRDIRTVLEQAEIDQRKFAHIYKDGQNREQPCYELPRRECDLVMSGYSVKYRLAIIDRWQELEAKHTPSPLAMLNDPATMRSLLLGYTEQVINLQAEVATLAPKAAGLDRIADTQETYCITDAAKTLNVQPKRLFDFLESQKWIYRRHGEWIAMQDKLNTRLMIHKIRVYEGSASVHTVTQARLTAKGVAKLSELLSSAA
jgi:phage regulator Rha-like protein/phage antirepressor YoqD-like protein